MTANPTLPDEFVQRIHSQYNSESEELLAAIDLPSCTSIRYHPVKYNGTIGTDKVFWHPRGEFLDSRPNFTIDPHFHAGRYYVQEASSMFLDFVLRQIKHEIKLDTVLDFCAAPGGKSTIILEHLEKTQIVIANEIISTRNIALRQNLNKWGYPNFIVTQSQAKEFKKLDHTFDCVVLDPPCSGEGLFRKDLNARSEWSVKNTKASCQRQSEILANIWPSLKPGGILIYSTCTYHPDENEYLLQAALDSGLEFDCIDMLIQKEWNVHSIMYRDIIGYQFLPHKVRGEGFFISVLRKKGNYLPSPFPHSRTIRHTEIDSYLNLDRETPWSTYRHQEHIRLAPNRALDFLPKLQSGIMIKQVGIDMVSLHGAEGLPSHGLSYLCEGTMLLDSLDLDLTQALDYLSGNPVSFSHNVQDGLFALQFEKYSLGFLEIKNGRQKSILPASLQIRMDWRKAMSKR